MGRSQIDDLKIAKEVLDELNLTSTAKLVQAMEENVANRRGISWHEIQAFLDNFKAEARMHSETCEQTFEAMEKIILQSLDDSNDRELPEFQNRALHAPSIDHHINALDAGLPTIHAEIKVTTRIQTCALLLMFGHTVRWQALEDFAIEWVGHWGKGFSKDRKKTGAELLLTVKFAGETPNTLKADSRMYRNAVAHGHFQFKDEQHIEFWNRDKCSRKHKLPPLTLGDLLELYNRTEIRFRTMEAFSRVIRAWGRHASNTK